MKNKEEINDFLKKVQSIDTTISMFPHFSGLTEDNKKQL